MSEDHEDQPRDAAADEIRALREDLAQREAARQEGRQDALSRLLLLAVILAVGWFVWQVVTADDRGRDRADEITECVRDGGDDC